MSGISRRDFLKLGLGAAATALLPRIAAGQEEEAAGPVLGVARGDNDKLVRAALDEIGGIAEYINPGETVCIKPNISFSASSEFGATTSVGVVKQVVELCLEAGAEKVIIVDYPLHDTRLCIENTNIREALVDPKKVSLLMLSQERQFSEVPVPDGTELTSVKVAKVVLQSHRLINLPTAKSHSATGVSLGLKNLMGLVWERGAMHHMNLHRAIAELGTVIKPDLIIVDATRALTTGGPGGPGKTVELNTVVAGTDPVAVDSYAVGLTDWYNRSYTGSKVKYIAAAAQLGLGEIDTEKMEIREVEV